MEVHPACRVDVVEGAICAGSVDGRPDVGSNFWEVITEWV